jgi:hypothetical protein
MSTNEDKLREKLVDAKIADVTVNDIECHGIAGIKITLYDGSVIEFYARERNGGGLIVVDTGDDLVS